MNDKPRPPRKPIREACLLVASHFHGEPGVWAYHAYDSINDRFFGGRLPWPYITWGLTPHGACLGYSTIRHDAPVIVLHPSIMGALLGHAVLEGENGPWGFPPDWLGRRMAFDLILHEMMHVS